MNAAEVREFADEVRRMKIPPEPMSVYAANRAYACQGRRGDDAIEAVERANYKFQLAKKARSDAMDQLAAMVAVVSGMTTREVEAESWRRRPADRIDVLLSMLS